MARIFKLLAVVWALPNSLFGCGIGLLGWMTGGRIQVRRGAVEFFGGLISWILPRLPNSPRAMTLGHSILGTDATTLDEARDHEQVHVRQYERWGPLFIPAYLLSSAYMKYKGKDAYYDNPFEVEAYSLFPGRDPSAGSSTPGHQDDSRDSS